MNIFLLHFRYYSADFHRSCCWIDFRVRKQKSWVPCVLLLFGPWFKQKQIYMYIRVRAAAMNKFCVHIVPLTEVGSKFTIFTFDSICLWLYGPGSEKGTDNRLKWSTIFSIYPWLVKFHRYMADIWVICNVYSHHEFYGLTDNNILRISNSNWRWAWSLVRPVNNSLFFTTIFTMYFLLFLQ